MSSFSVESIFAALYQKFYLAFASSALDYAYKHEPNANVTKRILHICYIYISTDCTNFFISRKASQICGQSYFNKNNMQCTVFIMVVNQRYDCYF